MWFLGDIGTISPRLGLLQEVHNHQCCSCVTRRQLSESRSSEGGTHEETLRPQEERKKDLRENEDGDQGFDRRSTRDWGEEFGKRPTKGDDDDDG